MTLKKYLPLMLLALLGSTAWAQEADSSADADASAPAAAAELVPGRDYDPDTGEVYETAGQPTDDRQTTGGRNNMKVVKIAPAKEA